MKLQKFSFYPSSGSLCRHVSSQKKTLEGTHCPPRQSQVIIAPSDNLVLPRSRGKLPKQIPGANFTFTQALSSFAVTLNLTYLFKKGVLKARVFTHPHPQLCPSVKPPAEHSSPREAEDLPPLSVLTVLQLYFWPSLITA